MKLLALVLLLSAFSSLSLTEVVNSFIKSCPSFFLQNPKIHTDYIVPTVFTGRQYKMICQRWNNNYRFATVYDTERRIPVYSAYTFLQQGQIKRSDEWKIEPQLEDFKKYEDKREMIVSPNDEETVNKIKKQAVDLDYKDTGFTRGHVFPNQYGANQDQADSTFTLTNIAPQTDVSNGQWAAQVETPMMKDLKNSCTLDQNHLAYIVTGAVPGEKWIRITRNNEEIKNGINIPSYYWSAFCCTDKKDIKKLVFRAYLAKLDNFDLRTPDISKLNKRLTELYGKDFSVFPGL
ncbi:endonuclease domain-containing 1 protein-like [Silurus asotus]|uniref:Endonuclease domain-containing 1 protein-like n=1 Tax=Silurus asotus TaxID=30991 RepID=A0AAD5ACG5_SILAS|nr:endonuclease domain-containing 1 protein-like [Silurus asotus]